MTSPRRPPFPAHLRQRRAARRRPAGLRWLATVLLVPLPFVGVTQWKVSRVEIAHADELNPSAVANLRSVVDTPVVLLDLDWIRRQADCWPAVAGVEVVGRLDGWVLVTARPSRAVASIRVGEAWHGVDAEGRPAGRLEGPREPVLRSCGSIALTLRRALSVARRLETGGVRRVHAVTPISPTVLEVSLTGSDRRLIAHVAVEPTASESLLTRLWRADELPHSGFVDATRDDRLVVRATGGAA